MILSNSEQFYGFGAGVVDYELLTRYKPRTALYVKSTNAQCFHIMFYILVAKLTVGS